MLLTTEVLCKTVKNKSPIDNGNVVTTVLNMLMLVNLFTLKTSRKFVYEHKIISHNSMDILWVKTFLCIKEMAVFI